MINLHNICVVQIHITLQPIHRINHKSKLKPDNNALLNKSSLIASYFIANMPVNAAFLTEYIVLVQLLINCLSRRKKVMTQQLKELLTSVDILNTLHGGVSEPFLSVVEKPTGREIRVRVPGVDRELVKAEINNNELSVYYIIPVESNGHLINMPKVVYRDVLPLSIELRNIEATYNYDELVIHLPYNRATDGYNKKIITDF
jgi:hypothetical protein